MRELPSTYEPLEVEREISRWWSENRIPEKHMKRGDGPLFRFLEGPPTANGFMHIGHVRGRTMKDIVLRFETMRGKQVWRRAGWDCQGLPVEIEAEKKLGLKSKRDVERVGLERFVEECNRIVDFYIDHWRRVSEKLGLWLDYDQAYETRRDSYIEFVWWFLKRAYEMGLLKEDLRVVPTCPRCETSLSSHEVSLGYTTIRDPSIYVKFPLEGREGEYIVIWTTTPWTIPGNEAVAVHPEYNYVRVKVSGEVWILAESLVKPLMEKFKVENYSVLETFKGRKLEGVRYVHPLLSEVPAHKSHDGRYDHAIVCGEHVTLEEGTGCVHTAPAHGPEDFEVGLKYGLKVFCPVDQKGIFTADGGKYAGRFFRDANREVVKDLEAKGLLVWAEEIDHEYPTCWRCETPLLYRVDKQWFLKMPEVRDKLLEENSKVKWFPEWAGKHRFGEWLAGIEDWCISRSRIWGSPLNVWKCQKCGEIRVIGSKEELLRLCVRKPNRIELHKPWIDEVVLPCSKCGGEMSRVPFVLDCWLDSGVAHSASIDALNNQELFKQLFPWDFITEAVDQTRGWFYSLLATSVILYGEAPYRRVLCQGLVLDKYGQKMSKSKGNVVWAEDALNNYGVDIVRAYLMVKAAPEDVLLFNPDELKQVKRSLSIIWNIFSFAVTYMMLDRFNPEEWPMEKVKDSLRSEDRWLLSRCQTVIEKVTENLENYRLHLALREILDFLVEDVSRFYIRLIRRRTWIETPEMDKMAAYYTLYRVLMDSVRLLAPFTPYLAEKLYQAISTGKIESVHLCDWPKPEKELIDKSLEADMDVCRKALTAILAARQRGQVKLRWPIGKIIISPKSREVKDSLMRLRNIINVQANCKEVEVLEAGVKPSFVMFKVKPKHSVLGSRFRELTPKIIEALKGIKDEDIERFKSEGKISINVDGKAVSISLDDVEIVEETPEKVYVEEFDGGRVFVDTELTVELMAEALAKEVVRRAQTMRKEMRLNIEDVVDAEIGFESPESVRLAESMADYLRREVRIRRLKFGGLNDVSKPSSGAYLREWDIEGEQVKILLVKVNGQA